MKDKYALLGYPLGHSFSQRFFTEKFERENINAEYLKFELPNIDDLKTVLGEHPELRGFNVTIPYKEQVIALLDELDKDAQEIGAVNVVKIIRTADGVKLKGYNSDMYGFQKSISPLLESHHKKALVLGTGGASKAVVQGLKNLGIDVKLVSRKSQNGMFTYDMLDDQILKEYTVIVNASPVGTFPNVEERPDIPYNYLTNKHLLYDLVYNPSETSFLKAGKEHGAKIKNGAEMLEKQALEAWRIWGC